MLFEVGCSLWRIPFERNHKYIVFMNCGMSSCTLQSYSTLKVKGGALLRRPVSEANVLTGELAAACEISRLPRVCYCVSPIMGLKLAQALRLPQPWSTWHRDGNLHISAPKREALLANPAGRQNQEWPPWLASRHASRRDNIGYKSVSFTKGADFVTQGSCRIPRIEANTGQNLPRIETYSSCTSIADWKPSERLLNRCVNKSLIDTHCAT